MELKKSAIVGGIISGGGVGRLVVIWNLRLYFVLLEIVTPRAGYSQHIFHLIGRIPPTLIT